MMPPIHVPSGHQLADFELAPAEDVLVFADDLVDMFRCFDAGRRRAATNVLAVHGTLADYRGTRAYAEFRRLR
eukprot:567107-Lingulodinium_polyedra.AAC.1